MRVKNSYGLLWALLLITACSEPKNHPAPQETFFQVGLFGHGRGVLGDIGINVFALPRRCDSCHSNQVAQHGKLGTCNRCHQPSFLGWKHTLFSPKHADVFSFMDKSYHQDLNCNQCHQNLANEQGFKVVSCNHCHNHGPSDIAYAHDLLDDYTYSIYSKNSACISCHSKSGERYSKYYDPQSHELF